MTDNEFTTSHQEFVTEDADRAHRWIRATADHIQSIVHARDAKSILPDTLRTPVSLVVLPVWLWVEADPGIVGRKATFKPGQSTRPLMPVRLVWHGGSVQTPSEGEHRLTWTMSGMGGVANGTTTVTVVPKSHQSSLPVSNFVSSSRSLITRLPTSVAQTTMTPTSIEDLIKQTTINGNHAWWELLTTLERILRECLDRQHVSLMRDIDSTVTKLGPQDFGQPLLDAETLDAMATGMSLGADGVPGQSYLSDLIDKCCKPERFAKVDPQRYLYVEISRKAGSAVQQRVGDPAIGRKIRKVYADSGGADPEEVIAMYREEYPRDGLSYKRLTDALNIIRDPMAEAVRVDFQTLDIDHDGQSWYLV